MTKNPNPMEEVLRKLSAAEISLLMRAFSMATGENVPRSVQKVELPPHLLRECYNCGVTDDDVVASSSSGNLALSARSIVGNDEWIIDSGASRHVTGTAGKFSSYTRLAVPENIQTADGTNRSVVGKGTVRCTNSLTLSNVLHVPSFSVNLLSISAIILELNCTVIFDIPKMIFQEKRTGRRLGTGTWHRGLWHLDCDGMNSALSSIVGRSERVGSSIEDLLLVHHRRLGHPSFALLKCLYPILFEQSNKMKLVCDACELGKHTRSSYISSGSRSAHVFDLIHSDVWGPCPVPTSDLGGDSGNNDKEDNFFMLISAQLVYLKGNNKAQIANIETEIEKSLTKLLNTDVETPEEIVQYLCHGCFKHIANFGDYIGDNGQTAFFKKVYNIEVGSEPESTMNAKPMGALFSDKLVRAPQPTPEMESRYPTVFTELETIGRGGFDEVALAKNKLDNMDYGIKKVQWAQVDMPFDDAIRELIYLVHLTSETVGQASGQGRAAISPIVWKVPAWNMWNQVYCSIY